MNCVFVQTKNQEEKRLWVHYLKKLIVENHPTSLPQKVCVCVRVCEEQFHQQQSVLEHCT